MCVFNQLQATTNKVAPTAAKGIALSLDGKVRTESSYFKELRRDLLPFAEKLERFERGEELSKEENDELRENEYIRRLFELKGQGKTINFPLIKALMGHDKGLFIFLAFRSEKENAATVSGNVYARQFARLASCPLSADFIVKAAEMRALDACIFDGKTSQKAYDMARATIAARMFEAREAAAKAEAKAKAEADAKAKEEADAIKKRLQAEARAAKKAAKQGK